MFSFVRLTMPAMYLMIGRAYKFVDFIFPIELVIQELPYSLMILDDSSLPCIIVTV